MLPVCCSALPGGVFPCLVSVWCSNCRLPAVGHPAGRALTVPAFAAPAPLLCPAVATNNLYATLLRNAPASTSRKVAGECVKKLDAFMERSGAWVGPVSG